LVGSLQIVSKSKQFNWNKQHFDRKSGKKRGKKKMDAIFLHPFSPI
jgi:hypothetical protein